MLRARSVAVRDAAVVKRWVTPRRAAVLRTVGVPVLVVAALVWLAVVVLRAGGSGPPRLTAEFPDVSGGSYLDVQLNHSVKAFGSFSAFLPGEGRVWPTARVKGTRTSAGAVNLSYDGAGYLDAAARADGTTSAHHFRPRRVRLRLVGQVGPTDHRASVDVWVNGRHWRIVSRAEVGGAEAVVSQFLGAVNDHDWNRLYDLSDRYMRNGVPRNKFVIGIGAGAANRITEAQAMGPTTYTTTGAGVRFARVPIRLTYGSGTAMMTVDAALVLAVDTGGWKVLSVE
jgi:hypothetical protein